MDDDLLVTNSINDNKTFATLQENYIDYIKRQKEKKISNPIKHFLRYNKNKVNSFYLKKIII